MWREQERIDGDRTELDQQRCQLDRDRQLLIEAAKKLDREVGGCGYWWQL